MKAENYTFGNDFEAIAFARIPEELDDQQRKENYDHPLSASLAESKCGVFLRSFSGIGQDGDSIGLEVRLTFHHSVAFFAECLRKLQAPLDTIIEAETEMATMEFKLSDLA